jgi:hypothetical protein
MNANLQSANLEGVYNLTIEQLSGVKTLYKSKLDPVLMKQVNEKYPHLLEEPIEELIEEQKPDSKPADNSTEKITPDKIGTTLGGMPRP